MLNDQFLQREGYNECVKMGGTNTETRDRRQIPGMCKLCFKRRFQFSTLLVKWSANYYNSERKLKKFILNSDNSYRVVVLHLRGLCLIPTVALMRTLELIR